MLETTVCTIDVNVPYDEWMRRFDNEEAPARSAKGIKVIFRGVSKNNPEKGIVVVQALEGVFGKHIQENIEIFERKYAVMSTAEPSVWS
ncbi:DUF3764 family protein [Prochlorococcus marinus]|uniref:DUF3764 family protein n=1 Tax=Prochlorococcus marinus TaxID=1219 RepID=UPI0022B44925|nr:DUF3764 family protein [Prochlorococcus marinus]